MAHHLPNVDPPAEVPTLEEQLVAYLDGELDAQESHRIEELLAADPEVRGRLQRLERTWQLLEELDRPDVNDGFTQTTLEMVAVAATHDAEQEQAEAPRRRRRRWLLVGGSLVAAGLAGFLAIAWLWPNPNQQLLQDLPLLQNLEQYRHVESIDFLRKLAQPDLFDKDRVGGEAEDR